MWPWKEARQQAAAAKAELAQRRQETHQAGRELQESLARLARQLGEIPLDDGLESIADTLAGKRHERR